MDHQASDHQGGNQRFPKRRRLRSRRDFAAVYRLRKRSGDTRLTVLARANGLDYSRLGLSVSRKVGKAHIRNGWKRRLREAFRTHREEIPAGFDFVVIPRPADAVPEYAAIVRSLLRQTAYAAKKWGYSPR